jgi:ribosome-binding protein aMBF1 (putative translation factor)
LTKVQKIARNVLTKPQLARNHLRMDARERFDRWLDECGRSRSRVAAELGSYPSQVSRIASGERRPSIDMAAKIERLTGGAVRATDWANL